MVNDRREQREQREQARMAKTVDTRCRTYGLEKSGYEAMRVAQQFCCAICGEQESTPHGLHIDHDHASGQVRALLCMDCNIGLGNFKDDPSRLAMAIAYLAGHAAAVA